MIKKDSKIVIPNDLAYIGSVLSYAAFLTAKIGFSAKETAEIGSALKEACENVVTHAFDSFEDESFTISFEILDNGIKILVDEMGLPFTVSEAEKEKDTPGLNAMEENMDEVRFVNRGKEGKELELYKFFKGKHVEEIYTEQELKPYESCDIPRAKTRYEFRLMKPEEAASVSRCIYRAYKYTYLNEDLYFPERIEARNRDGSMISYVAVSDSGEVVAHFALLPRPNGKVAEVGIAVVVPEHRNKKLMKILLHKLIIEAGERDFFALYGNAFTMHTLSQRTNLNFYFSETALQLAVFPPESIRIMKENGLKGAGNVMTFFKCLRRAKDCKVYIPRKHAKTIMAIYAGLGIKRLCQVRGPDYEITRREESELHLSIKSYHKTASIEVENVGLDIDKRIKAKRLELANKGFNSIYIDLSLADPNTPWAVSRLEEIGFFFSGLFPEFYKGDSLRLQYYITDVMYDEIETASRFARELKEYVRKLDPKWAALNA